ncbi:TPK1, partial [Symbiodinium necroappetens]
MDTGEASSESDEDAALAWDLPFYVRHPTKVNIIALILYAAVGICVMSFKEDWTLVTSFYVTVQIITTVGYGDIAPTESGELFLIFYVLLGTVLLAGLLDRVTESLLAASDQRLHESLEGIRTLVRSGNQDSVGSTCGPTDGIFTLSRSVYSLLHWILVYLFFLAAWVAYFMIFEGCSCSYGATRIDGCEEGQRCEATGGVQLSALSASYMGVITFSTVGFGDFSPKSRKGRIFGSIWMILGIMAFGKVVTHVSTLLQEWRMYHKNRVLVSRRVFERMDRNRSGKVARSEFVLYMLVRQGRVKQETIQDIEALFKDLDQDKNGSLTFDEINGRLLPSQGRMLRERSGGSSRDSIASDSEELE